MVPFVIPFMKWYYGEDAAQQIISEHASYILSKILDVILGVCLGFMDLIQVDLSPLVKYFVKINSFFPLDVLFVDFGIIFGVWVTCLGFRAIINVAPSIGG